MRTHELLEAAHSQLSMQSTRACLQAAASPITQQDTSLFCQRTETYLPATKLNLISSPEINNHSKAFCRQAYCLMPRNTLTMQFATKCSACLHCAHPAAQSQSGREKGTLTAAMTFCYSIVLNQFGRTLLFSSNILACKWTLHHKAPTQTCWAVQAFGPQVNYSSQIHATHSSFESQ